MFKEAILCATTMNSSSSNCQWNYLIAIPMVQSEWVYITCINVDVCNSIVSVYVCVVCVRKEKEWEKERESKERDSEERHREIGWYQRFYLWMAYQWWSFGSHLVSKVCDEITYPFTNFNGCTVEVWEWINYFIPHFIMDAVTYLCLDFFINLCLD